jgi:hypothetical protein
MDPRLSEPQKRSLLAVYRRYLAANGHATGGRFDEDLTVWWVVKGPELGVISAMVRDGSD